jgi:hypothetical protein
MEEACGLYRRTVGEWRNRARQAEARVQQLQSLVQLMGATPPSLTQTDARRLG